MTKERRLGHWIGVHRDHWRSLLGGRYADVIRLAESLGFIETNHRYSSGRFSKSYRLAKEYRIPKSREYILKRRKSGEGPRIRIDDSDAVGTRLAGWFEHASLPTLDAAAGWDQFSVRSVYLRQWYAVRCAYGRFHSSFTALPKAQRQRLLLAGENSVEIDIANSQPLFLSILANANNPVPTPVTTPGKAISICGTVLDSQRFLELTSIGQLYTHFQRATGWSRRRVKRSFIVMMFADVQTTTRMKIFGLLNREFPTIAEFIVESKRHQYQDLAKLLQRFESQTMIDGVAGGLDFPVLTVHDSIIVPKENSQAAVDAIRKRFTELGSNVTIKQGF